VIRAHDRLGRRSILLPLLAVAAAGSLTAAARATTGPSPHVDIYVNLTDRGAVVAVFGTGSEDGNTNLEVQELTRGNIATVLVHNLGKENHSFAAFGKHTAPLSPGAKARFRVTLLYRGTFPWSEQTPGVKPVKGAFVVH
jgi:hypothetical protein